MANPSSSPKSSKWTADTAKIIITIAAAKGVQCE
jgi:hypothetical protein